MKTLRRLLAATTAAAVTAVLALVPVGAAQAAEEVYPAPSSGYWTVDGRGWGHGRGMSQWGSQGAALAGVPAHRILSFYYPGTNQHFLGNPRVTVALTRYAPTSTVTVWAPRGRTIRMGGINAEQILPAGRWTVTVSGGTVTAQRRAHGDPTGPVTETRTYTGALNTTVLRFESCTGQTVSTCDQGGMVVAPSPTSTTGRWYRGDLQIVPTGSGGGAGFDVRNGIFMEDYLRSVVPRESPASWEYAALEAQSVAARSYAWHKVVNGNPLCDTTACQVYFGRGDANAAGDVTEPYEHARTDEAIRRTGGTVLYYGGRIAFTEFSSNNGGWTTASDVPYQVAKEDPWTGPSAPRTTWEQRLTVAAVEQSCPSGGKLRNLVVVSRTGLGPLGGRVTRARLECTTGNREISTPAFGMYSSWWKPRPTTPVLGSPAISATTTAPGQAVVIGVTPNVSMSWTLTVRDTSTGRVAQTVTGSATVGVRFNAGWDTSYSPRAAGVSPYVGPGVYELTLVGKDATGKTTAPVVRRVTVTKPADPPRVAAVPLVPNAGYVALPPKRLLDTRTTFQSLGAGQRVDLTVLGREGVPTTGVSAVVLNVTMVAPTTDGHLRVWPAGSNLPNASAVNTTGRRTQASLVTVGVGGQGKVSLWNAAGTTHYLVDVLGYYTTSLTTSSRYLAAQAPVRAADTRSGGPLTATTPLTVDVAAALKQPAGSISAATVNVTTTRAGGNGYVVAYGSGALPPTSTVNHMPGADVANRAVVPVVNGKITVALRGAPAHVVVDVTGWYAARGATTGAVFTPVQPTRLLDTRSGRPLGAGETRSLTVTGGVVPSGATALVGTLTAVEQTAPVTHARVWPAGLPLTPTSDLNSGSGRTQSNTVVVRPGTGGAVQLYNDAGQSDLILDAVGYFR
ncbi:SpoIID/LytB domain-containing protein [Actinotalea sp. AC32]|nr:SpoIID/LytB domain-containing protein [Actinotalea sp. AC32]